MSKHKKDRRFEEEYLYAGELAEDDFEDVNDLEENDEIDSSEAAFLRGFNES